MAIQIEQILEELRKEYTKILEGPGVTWNKKGMEVTLEKAIARALAKFMDVY